MNGKARLKWAKMSVGLCLLLTTGYTQDDPLLQPVTYDQPAQTVKQLLDALSRQTGVRLFAPSPIDSEFVLVMVRDMPLKELMDHLAVVTDGEWFKQPNGSYHLVRTPKIIKERRQQDDEQILKGLKRALSKKENQRLIPPLSEQEVRQAREKVKESMREIEAQGVSPQWRDPAVVTMRENLDSLDVPNRLVVRLLQQMDLRRLLEIPVGERRVFSNVRGRYLLPLGFPVEPLLQQYAQESQLVYQAWTHPIEGIDPQRVEQFNKQYGYLIITDDELRQKPLSKPPTRVYLVVRRDAPGGFTCRVALASDDLKESRSENGSYLYLRVSDDEDEEDEEKDTKQAQHRKTSEPSSQPPAKVEWSERSRQFIEAYRAMERTTDVLPWPAILDPSQTEPLSLIPSDVLRTYARQQGKSLIALLTESFVWCSILALIEQHEIMAYLRRFLKWETELQEKETLILLKPRFFSYMWGQRTDRTALMQWIERVRQQGYVGTKDCIALSKLVPNMGSLNAPVSQLYLGILLEEPLWWFDNCALELRFLSNLTPAQMDQLRAGREISFAALTPAQREQLIRALYFGATSLTITWNPTELWEVSNPIDLIHAFYPDGLPTDLTIQTDDTSSLREEWHFGVFTRRKAGVWSDFCQLASLAYELYLVQDAQSQPWMDEDTLRYYRERAERYQTLPLMPAKRKPFSVQVRLSQNHTVQLLVGSEFGDYELLNDGKPTTLDTLPKELKEKLEKEMERYKAAPKPDGY